MLPDETWRRRHRVIVAIAWLHVPTIVGFGVWAGSTLDHALQEALVVAVAAFLAGRQTLGRTMRALMASFGLLTASAILVHLSGGAIEMHFHFFVVVPLLALYQDWVPFLGSVAYVVAHHLVIGVIDPGSVFSHPAGQQNPLLWSLIHGGFIAAVSLVSVVAWSMSQRAFTDSLTQLATRTLFLDRLDDAIGSASRTGRPGPAVLFIDLDDFKTVNDSLGHTAGDELLAAVGKRIRSRMRTTDTAARLGGDEFAIMLQSASTQTALDLSDRLLEVLRRPYTIQGHRVTVGASAGIAHATAATRDGAEVLRDADTAMYLAKASGKGQAEVFQPVMHTAALERLRVKGELLGIVDRGELRVEYQPIVDLVDGRLVGAEALVRWQHPERGLLGPSQFIALAEETGEIVGIGSWVLAEACRQMQSWHMDLPDLSISVNLSVRQLADPQLVTSVARTLEETRLAPGRLVLEITESVVMDDIEANVPTLDALKALGIRIAIDDFGTGYSSLNYLRRLPVDILKLDRSFVMELEDEAADRTLAQIVVALGQTLGLQTLAEGIEVESQRTLLVAAGCTHGQGFLFARPMAAELFAELIAEHQLAAGASVTAAGPAAPWVAAVRPAL